MKRRAVCGSNRPCDVGPARGAGAWRGRCGLQRVQDGVLTRQVLIELPTLGPGVQQGARGPRLLRPRRLNGKWWRSHRAVTSVAPGKQDRGTDLRDPVWQVGAAPGQTQRLPGAHGEGRGEEVERQPVQACQPNPPRTGHRWSSGEGRPSSGRTGDRSARRREAVRGRAPR